MYINTFNNIFLISDFYGSLSDKILKCKMQKNMQKLYKNVLLPSLYFVLCWLSRETTFKIPTI